mmetsp:Transcript_2529/g.3490  ORF Transcript_2529/g.3490 Transcript_2529/m.3490 type:complete len:292 (+) Transcript_2529:275-1150(+)
MFQEQKSRGLGHMNSVPERVGLHPGGGVDSVPEEAKPRIHVAHHGGHHRARVEPHPDVHAPKLRRLQADQGRIRSANCRDGELCDVAGVLRLLFDEVGHGHVGVSNCLHLEYVMYSCQLVEVVIQPVKHRHHLDRRQRHGDVGEANNVREEDGHAGVVLRLHLLPCPEGTCNLGREDIIEQLSGRPLRASRLEFSNKVVAHPVVHLAQVECSHSFLNHHEVGSQVWLRCPAGSDQFLHLGRQAFRQGRPESTAFLIVRHRSKNSFEGHFDIRVRFRTSEHLKHGHSKGVHF